MNERFDEFRRKYAGKLRLDGEASDDGERVYWVGSLFCMWVKCSFGVVFGMVMLVMGQAPL